MFTWPSKIIVINELNKISESMKTLKTLFLSVALIACYTLTAQVAITTDGSSADGSAMLELKSTSKGFLPPRMTVAERDAIDSPAEGLMIYETDSKTWQGFNGTNWVNTNGSSCSPNTPAAIIGNDVVNAYTNNEEYSIDAVQYATSYEWTVPSDATITSGQGTTSITVDFRLEAGNVSVRAQNGCGNSVFTNLYISVGIGYYYEGGVVFYFFQDGDPGYVDGEYHGLICAISDQDGGIGIQWYNGSYTTTGATATAIGSGQTNTTTIIAEQGAGSYAATVCDNYTVDGYDDWFLPSRDELNEMYQNKAAIDATATANGGQAFVGTIYWSSSEYSNYYAWLQDFSNGSQSFLVGNQSNYDKNHTNRVRAVRAF